MSLAPLNSQVRIKIQSLRQGIQSLVSYHQIKSIPLEQGEGGTVETLYNRGLDLTHEAEETALIATELSQKDTIEAGVDPVVGLVMSVEETGDGTLLDNLQEGLLLLETGEDLQGVSIDEALLKDHLTEEMNKEEAGIGHQRGIVGDCTPLQSQTDLEEAIESSEWMCCYSITRGFGVLGIN